MWPNSWLCILSDFDPWNDEPSMTRTEPAVKRTDYSDGTATRSQLPAENRRKDLLCRYTPTPHGVDLLVTSKTVRLESNSPTVIESALGFFARHQGQSPGHPEFLWRIVSQEDHEMDEAGVALSAFSDRGLRFANIGHRSFLAVDLEAREGIGFVADRLVEREPKLNCRSLFDTLFCMTAASLGIVPLSAACVGMGERGLLIFGPPNSGKTTASYLAAKLGLEFHADQAVFLEMEGGRLRVWGDFLPAIFRPESLQFLPELRTSTRRFSYPELTVHYLPKRPFQADKAHPVAPVCCVFLERDGATFPSLSRITRVDLSRRLAESTLFKDYDAFAQSGGMVFSALEKLPAYHLSYGSDPASVATLAVEMLTDCEVLEDWAQQKHAEKWADRTEIPLAGERPD
jgi:hypothetical protein